MKHLIAPGLSLVLALFFVGCGLSDIRPDTMVESGYTEADVSKGREVLRTMMEAHGGLEAWRAHRTAQVELTDTWHSAVVSAAVSPWPENGQLVRQTLLLGSETSRLVFVGGDEDGNAWGIQNWITYTAQSDKNPTFEENSAITFWLPTVQYFIEAPFRLHEADVVVWAGEEKDAGKTYDKVFLSWGTDAPQDTIDQYMAWVDQETGRLAYLEYTVRDMTDFTVGMMRYQDYKTIQGIQVAHTMRVVDGLSGDDKLHRMDIQKIQFATGVSDDYLIPDPSQKGSK